MARLAPRTVRPSRCAVLPHVSTGDYYVWESPATGRTWYVYPRAMQERYFPIVKGDYSPMAMSSMGDVNVNNPAGAIQSSMYMSLAEMANVVSQTARQAGQQANQQSLADQARYYAADPSAIIGQQESLPSASAGRTAMIVGVGALGALALGWLVMSRKR